MIKSCLSCVHFEDRTHFCRKNPPQVVLGRNYDHRGDEVVFSATFFPKIDRPELDYCSEWKKR
jgi:hypothetical protein